MNDPNFTFKWISSKDSKYPKFKYVIREDFPREYGIAVVKFERNYNTMLDTEWVMSHLEAIFYGKGARKRAKEYIKLYSPFINNNIKTSPSKESLEVEKERANNPIRYS